MKFTSEQRQRMVEAIIDRRFEKRFLTAGNIDIAHARANIGREIDRPHAEADVAAIVKALAD